MNGILVYSREGYERNKWFAEEIIFRGKCIGVNVELVIIDECSMGIDNDGAFLKYNDRYYRDADFALVRTMSPDVTMFLENMGIPCFNNSRTAMLCNDKFITYTLVSGTDIPTIPTALSNYGNIVSNIDNFFDEFNTDEIVVKTTDGHGGKEVFLIDKSDAGSVEKILGENSGLTGKEFCVQPRIKGKARDLRVYMLGGQVYAAMIRSSERDFRANISQGGEFSVHVLTEEQRIAALEIYRLTQGDFIGIDFIIDSENGIFFNEVEDVVGTRMLYRSGGYDVARDILEYIIDTLND